MSVAIIYGSNLGNTAEIAKLIAKELGINEEHVYDVNDIKPQDVNHYDKFILGTSTWGVGDMQDGWLDFDFKKFDLKNKTVALFGLGDSQIYAFTFCNGLAKLHRAIQGQKEMKIVGQVDPKNYTFSESEAIIKGKFIGLVLDYDNYPDQAIEQTKKWVEEIKKHFI